MQTHRYFRLVFILLLLTLALCTPALMRRGSMQDAQPAAPPKYAVFEYFKAVPGKLAEQRQLQRELWLPIHRERAKRGLIKSWSLWESQFPSGPQGDFDFVTITTYEKFAEVEASYPAEVFTQAHPKLTPKLTEAEINRRTELSRQQPRTELMRLASHTELNPQPLPPGLMLDFFQADNGGAYLSVENKYWKPMHEERIKREMLRGWQVYGAIYPSGADRPYNFITLGFYDKFAQFETPYTTELVIKANPGVNLADMSKQTDAARKFLRKEVLKLVEQAP